MDGEIHRDFRFAGTVISSEKNNIFICNAQIAGRGLKNVINFTSIHITIQICDKEERC